jgi:hypothetical protein
MGIRTARLKLKPPLLDRISIINRQWPSGKRRSARKNHKSRNNLNLPCLQNNLPFVLRLKYS